jgi:polar amino acid transport system ATP-binding protein
VTRPPVPPPKPTRLEAAIEAATSRIAPAWPLESSIAVDPWWGFVGTPLPLVGARLAALAGLRSTPPRAWFREQLRRGAFSTDDLRWALAENRAELARLRLESGLVFQTWHLFPHRTALENVYEAPVHVKRLPVELARNRAKLLLAKVGLSHREDAMPRNMSGGEQQRCAIARALAMEPKVLFMDEPTSALDPQRVGDLVELLDHLKRSEKLTFVIVTHEMKFAEKLADRTLVLFEGHVIEDGHPRDILVAPKDPRTRTFLGLEDA